jgi:hypothetical protein
MLNILPKHLKGKPEKIGTVDGEPMFFVETTGGLNIIATQKNGNFTLLSMAPHSAICKHSVSKNCKNVVFNELCKSESIDIEQFKDMIAKYEEITNKINNFLKLNR